MINAVWKILRRTFTAVSLILLIAVLFFWKRSQSESESLYLRPKYVTSQRIDSYNIEIETSKGALIFNIVSLHARADRGDDMAAARSQVLDLPAVELQRMLGPQPTPRLPNGFTWHPGVHWVHDDYAKANLRYNFNVYDAVISWWLVAALLAIAPALGTFRLLKNRRPPPGHCPTCGYDLRATPTRCPECGATPKSSIPHPPSS